MCNSLTAQTYDKGYIYSNNMKDIIKNLIKKVYSLTIIENVGWWSVDHRWVGTYQFKHE